jgi:hypothetical protein
MRNQHLSKLYGSIFQLIGNVISRVVSQVSEAFIWHGGWISWHLHFASIGIFSPTFRYIMQNNSNHHNATVLSKPRFPLHLTYSLSLYSCFPFHPSMATNSNAQPMHRHRYIRVSAPHTNTVVLVCMTDDQRHQCVRVAVEQAIIESSPDQSRSLRL